MLAIMLYALLWYGRHRTFEKLLTVLVIVMGLCFVLVAVMVRPSAITELLFG
jgi:manganese transport protein